MVEIDTSGERCPRCQGTRLVPLPQGMSSGFYAFMAPGCRTVGGLMMNCPVCTRATAPSMDKTSAGVPLRAGAKE